MKSVSETTKGIVLIITSAFCFAMMAVFVRLSGEIHFVQKAFFRKAVAFLIALFEVLKEIKKGGIKSVAIPKGSLLFLFLRAA